MTEENGKPEQSPPDLLSISDLEKAGDTITPEVILRIEGPEKAEKCLVYGRDQMTVMALVISERLKALEDRMTRLEYRKLRKGVKK